MNVVPCHGTECLLCEIGRQAERMQQQAEQRHWYGNGNCPACGGDLKADGATHINSAEGKQCSNDHREKIV